MQAVRIDEKGRVLDAVATISKKQNENLTWVALRDGGPWKITFDKNGSPFNPGTYTVAPGAWASTTKGPVTGNAGSTYKYTVRRATTNEVTDDPDVDVEP
jgi:hypothetical protein